MEDKKNVIYGLCDPRDGQLRYVGKTQKKLRDRFGQHIGLAHRLRDHCHSWIVFLRELGLLPDAFVIEELPDGDDVRERLNAAEVFHIQYFWSIGCRLTNIAPGGEGVGAGPQHPFWGKHQTPEAREKIRLAGLGRIFSDERKSLISESLKGERNPRFGKASPMKGLHHSDEVREKLRVSQLGRKRPGQSGDNHWTRRLGRSPNKGKKMPSEGIEKMRAALKGRKLRPEEVARRSKRVVCLNDGTEFSSQSAAAEALGLSKLDVSRCCRDGKERKGYRFAFLRS